MTIRWSAVSAISLIRCAGDEDRAALGGQALEQVADPADALRVEAVDRLVEDQRRRVAEQRGGDAEPLPHAEREAAGPLAGHLRAGRPASMHLVDPASRGCRAVAASASRWLRAERPVCTALASSSAPTSCSGAAWSRVAPAVDGDRAGGRPVQAEDHPHRGGLAGAVRPEEAGDDAGPDGERQVVDGDLVAVPLGQFRALRSCVAPVARVHLARAVRTVATPATVPAVGGTPAGPWRTAAGTHAAAPTGIGWRGAQPAAHPGRTSPLSVGETTAGPGPGRRACHRPVDVGLRGQRADDQPLGDLVVGQPVRDQAPRTSRSRSVSTASAPAAPRRVAASGWARKRVISPRVAAATAAPRRRRRPGSRRAARPARTPLPRNPLAPARSACEDVLVELEGGQDQHRDPGQVRRRR